MFNRRRLTLVAAAAACLFVATGASANPLDTFTGVAAPSYVKPSSTTSFTVALTNDALSPDAAHRATVGIPLGFSVAPASVQATTTAVAGSCDASTWVADGEPIADQKIHLMRPGGDITALCPGATLTVTFTATSGAVDGAFAWTSELLNDVSGAFTLSGSQPGVVVDGTNPTVTLGGKPSNPSNEPSPSFTFSANETSTFECKLDAGAFAACTSPQNYPALADGAHSFTVRATDAAGNFGEASHSWTIDTVAPTVTLSGKPPNPSNDTSPTFTFSTVEAATFECQLDGGAFTACTSPQTYPAVGNGSHTFTVKGTDAANNVGQASYTWTIDTVAPTANVTDKPANPSNVKSPSFAFTATEPSTFDCKLDQNAVEPCSSPKSYSNLADGAHTFAVRAKDAAGNTGNSTYSWVIDTSPPTTTIGPKPANPSSDSTPSFGFTAGEPAAFECKLDGGAFAACSAPKTLGTLPDGAHTFTVRATDPAGNTGPEASYTWMIDTVAPAATIATKPPNPSNNKSPSFTFSAGEPSSFQCKLDAGAAAACTSPQSYADLADGAHTFIVRATDQAGNAGAPTSYTWTIDTVAPTATIGGKPTNPSNDKSPGFTFAASEQSTFACKLDAGAFASCTSPQTYSNQADGAHTFVVKATDAAGNTGAEAGYAWTIDTVAPIATIGTKPANPSNNKSPSFTFSAAEPSTFQCKLDAAVATACTSPQIYPDVADGDHTFTVRATDQAGNAGPATSYTWTIDTAGPTTTITANPSDPSNVKSPSFSFTSNQAGSVFACKLDAAAFAPCTSPVAYSNLGDGAHTFRVKGTDPAGNTGPEDVYAWTIDTAAPTASIGAKPSNPSNVQSPSFAFTAGEPATFECQLDGGAFGACVSPKNYIGLADGSHSFAVRATDFAHNVGTAVSYTWTIDATGPTATITSKPPNPSNTSFPSFEFAASENGSTFECKLDGAAFTPCTSPKGYSNLAEVAHTFTVKATDPIGNTGAESSYSWTVDTTPPVPSITGHPANPSNVKSPSFGFAADEPSTFSCKLDGGAFASCSSPKAYTNLADGAHTFAVRATDPAGNVSASVSFGWTIDTTDPIVTITQSPANPTKNQSASFAFTSDATQYQCKLDGAAFASCTSPKNYAALAEGPHTFAVKGTDALGNTGLESTYQWTIDTTAPTATITSKPNALSNDSSPSFSFTASENGSTFACRLEGGGFAACSSPKAFPGLGDGQHSFTVRATDGAGNTGADVTFTWTIDTVAPTTTIASKPADPSNVKSPSFTFTANELGSTFSCKLDAAAFAPCPSPVGYTNLADGSHTFAVKATDPAGNVGAEKQYSWAIDTAAPTATITGKPSPLTADATPSFTFSASESTATFQCKLDAGALGACTSPKNYAALADGPHTFVVKATDAAGNAGPDAAFTWTIDTLAPAASISSKPANPSNVAAPSFSFTTGEPAAFECKLDAAAFSACSAPKGYTGLTDGSHTFQVRATDTAGNVGGVVAYTWTIDTAAPTAAITSKPNDPSNTGSASFSFATNEVGASFVCRLDGGSFGPCASPAAYSSLGDGQHTFAVKATDAAGNSGSEAAYGWTIETHAPTAALIAGPSGLTNSSAATFSFSADEPSSFDCKVDGAGFEPCSSPATYHGLGDGGHGFSVRARDTVGNFSAPVSQSWTIDTTAPDTTISSAPKSGTATSATFAFSASEGGSFECRLDGAPFAVCASPKSYSPLRPGDHRFEVRAVDAAGNADPTPALHGWKVDVTVAKVTSTALLSPTAGARVTRPPLLVWRRVARAKYYNVQIYRGRVKVFTGWPTRTRLQLNTRWKLQGKVRKLTPGTYRWYVWPGYGSPATRRYGALLGQSTFVVTKR